MILYNWEKMYNFGNGSIKEVNRIFKMWVNREIPKNRRDPIYKYAAIDFSGTSFMLHPDILLYNSYKYDKRDIVQYIALCSYRSLGEYKAMGTISLDRYDAPEVPDELFYENPLIRLTDENRIEFLYEETPKYLN